MFRSVVLVLQFIAQLKVAMTTIWKSNEGDPVNLQSESSEVLVSHQMFSIRGNLKRVALFFRDYFLFYFPFFPEPLEPSVIARYFDESWPSSRVDSLKPWALYYLSIPTREKDF